MEWRQVDLARWELVAEDGVTVQVFRRTFRGQYAWKYGWDLMRSVHDTPEAAKAAAIRYIEMRTRVLRSTQPASQ